MSSDVLKCSVCRRDLWDSHSISHIWCYLCNRAFCEYDSQSFSYIPHKGKLRLACERCKINDDHSIPPDRRADAVNETMFTVCRWIVDLK